MYTSRKTNMEPHIALPFQGQLFTVTPFPSSMYVRSVTQGGVTHRLRGISGRPLRYILLGLGFRVWELCFRVLGLNPKP